MRILPVIIVIAMLAVSGTGYPVVAMVPMLIGSVMAAAVFGKKPGR